ncbi:MAG: hypothetical protein R3A79_30565 [Nannocystaceae bacterium]
MQKFPPALPLLAALALGACTGEFVEASASDGDSSSTSASTTATSSTTEATTTATTADPSVSGSGTDSATSDSTSSESESASAGTESTTTTATTGDTEPTTGATEPTTGEPTTTTTTGDTDTDASGTTGGDGLWDTPNLWYSVDTSIMYIEIDPMDGSVVTLVHNELAPDAPLWNGQNGLTMLEDGSLLGSRESAQGTQIFHVPDPPTTPNTPADAVYLGLVPNDMQNQKPIRVEALYTDCDGRIYLMDTGADVSSAEGNRLLRFTNDYLSGDLAFEVITDLENASVGDIDDMSPGIDGDELTDGVGFAMDSAELWQIDYTTGTGMTLANTDGTWGIHALGGPLFNDMMPRLYILSAGDANTGAELMEVNIMDYSNSAPLVEGPDLDLNNGYNGWSGLAGPLTECMTTIPQ